MFQLPFLDQFRNVVTYSHIDDFVDTLSCFATPSIYLFGAILISARTYVGSPIQCWIHQSYSGAWEEYAETFCFLKNTYFVPNTESVANSAYTDKSSVRYYQWSSMYLAVCALSFILPKLFWKYSQTSSDIPLTYFCETANEIRKTTAGDRKGKIDEMTKYLTEKLEHKDLHGGSIFTMTKAYFATKFFYIVIAVFQFLLLAAFLGQSDDLFWGCTLLGNLLMNNNWEKTGLFPRVTYCSFPIRLSEGNIQQHTTQCVLGVNEFNEKIFMFIFFWLVFLIIFTTAATLRAVIKMRKNSIVEKLMIKERANKSASTTIKQFSEKYLKTDGKMILSYVKMESDIVAQELAETLFENYKKKAPLDVPQHKQVPLLGSNEKEKLDEQNIV